MATAETGIKENVMSNEQKEMLERLVSITSGCRSDMHEPNEKGMTAGVIGTKFNNSIGDEICNQSIEDGFQEIVVILRREHEGLYLTERLNLATLISLARMAK